MNAVVAALAGLAGLAACAAAPGTPAPDSRPEAPTYAMPTDPVAQIAVQRPPAGDDRFGLTAQFEGPVAETLSYRLTVVRVGRAGRTQSAQSGSFSVSPGERQTLSTMQVNAGPGDRIEAELTVSREGGLVARDRFEETVPDAR